MTHFLLFFFTNAAKLDALGELLGRCALSEHLGHAALSMHPGR